jgi:hypothetical protein
MRQVVLRSNFQLAVWDLVYLEEQYRFLRAWARAVELGNTLLVPRMDAPYMQATILDWVRRANEAATW